MIDIQLVGDLSGVASVAVWRTTANESFEQLAPIAVTSGGAISLTIVPQSIYTLTSTTGQSKGMASTPPPNSSRFPASFSDDFESCVSHTSRPTVNNLGCGTIV